MSKREASVTLCVRIVDHACPAGELCAGRTLPDLPKDWRDTTALEREPEIVGEAVK